MKTGFVTTTRMSHATPAALYSKTASRFWECENDILDDIEDGNIEEDDVNFYKVHWRYRRRRRKMKNMIVF